MCSFVFSKNYIKHLWGRGVEQAIREVGSLGQTGAEKGGMEMPKLKGTEETRKRLRVPVAKAASFLFNCVIFRSTNTPCAHICLHLSRTIALTKISCDIRRLLTYLPTSLTVKHEQATFACLFTCLSFINSLQVDAKVKLTQM